MGSRDGGQNLVALVCFAFGGLLTISSLAGFLDDRVVYCDKRTDPCTEYIIPSHQAKNLKNIEALSIIPGNRNKLVLAMLGIPFFGVAWCLSGDLRKKAYAQVTVERARYNSHTKEIQEKESFLAESRVNQLKNQVVQKIAELSAWNNPELDNLELQDVESEPAIQHQPYYPTVPSQLQPNSYSPPQQYGDIQPPQQPVNLQPPSQPPQQFQKPVNPKFAKYYEIGEMALKGMVYAQRSILLASSSGTGKSTTEKEWIRRMMQMFPEIEFYALVQKAEDLCGLWDKGRMWVYRGSDIPGCLEPIDIVYEELESRRSTLGAENSFNNKPVRLILGDWFATFTNLNDTNSKICSNYCTKIGAIISVGRAYNVSIFCDTQSLNLQSLGLAKDANIRQSLEIYAQGFKHPDKGLFGDGDYNTMRRTIQNNHVCDPSFASALVDEIEKLSSAIAKKEIISPIIFMANIYPPALGLVPDLSNPTENFQPQQIVQTPVIDTHSNFVVESDPEPQVVEDREDLDVVIPNNAAQMLDGLLRLDRKYTPNNLSKDQLVSAINQLEPIMGRDRAIATLWMVSDPNSLDWKRAVSEYQEVKS
jgi:hypothetical protein